MSPSAAALRTAGPSGTSRYGISGTSTRPSCCGSVASDTPVRNWMVAGSLRASAISRPRITAIAPARAPAQDPGGRVRAPVTEIGRDAQHALAQRGRQALGPVERVGHRARRHAGGARDGHDSRLASGRERPRAHCAKRRYVRRPTGDCAYEKNVAKCSGGHGQRREERAVKRVAVKGAAAWLTLTLGLLAGAGVGRGGASHPPRRKRGRRRGPLPGHHADADPHGVRGGRPVRGPPDVQCHRPRRDAAAVFGAHLQVGSGDPHRPAGAALHAGLEPARSRQRQRVGRRPDGSAGSSARRRDPTRSAAGIAGWTTTPGRRDRSSRSVLHQGLLTRQGWYLLDDSTTALRTRGRLGPAATRPRRRLPGRLLLRLRDRLQDGAEGPRHAHRPPRAAAEVGVRQLVLEVLRVLVRRLPDPTAARVPREPRAARRPGRRHRLEGAQHVGRVELEPGAVPGSAGVPGLGQGGASADDAQRPRGDLRATTHASPPRRRSRAASSRPRRPASRPSRTASTGPIATRPPRGNGCTTPSRPRASASGGWTTAATTAPSSTPGLTPDSWINELYRRDGDARGLRGFSLARIGASFPDYNSTPARRAVGRAPLDRALHRRHAARLGVTGVRGGVHARRGKHRRALRQPRHRQLLRQAPAGGSLRPLAAVRCLPADQPPALRPRRPPSVGVRRRRPRRGRVLPAPARGPGPLPVRDRAPGVRHRAADGSRRSTSTIRARPAPTPTTPSICSATSSWSRR